MGGEIPLSTRASHGQLQTPKTPGHPWGAYTPASHTCNIVFPSPVCCLSNDLLEVVLVRTGVLRPLEVIWSQGWDRASCKGGSGVSQKGRVRFPREGKAISKDKMCEKYGGQTARHPHANHFWLEG